MDSSSSSGVGPDCVSVVGDSKSTLFSVDLSTPWMTASSIIYRGVAVSQSAPILVKLDLGTLHSVSASLIHSHACFPLYKAAVLKVNGSDSIDRSSPIPVDATTVHEVQVHNSIKQFHNSNPLPSLCLSIDTVGQGKGLVLPRQRALQPDTRSPRLPLSQVARLARDLCHGLSSVHEAGWVHCDVSVANVVVTADNTYQLIDFGLCQQLEPQSPCSTTDDDVPDACGTPGFVAPEVLAHLQLVNLHLDGPSPWMLPSPDLHFSSNSHSLFRSSSCNSIAESIWTAENYYPSSTPPRHEFRYLPSPLDSSSIVTPVSLGSYSPSLPALVPSRLRRHRILAARDIYSMGVVVGLTLSGYLPMCDADHLGGSRSNADYVRDHIVPKLYAIRRIIKPNSRSSLFSSCSYVDASDLLVLEWALDFVLQCLVDSPVYRPCAKTLLRRHPFCIWADAPQGTPVPNWLVDPATWMASPVYAAVRDAMEACKHEWEFSGDQYTSSNNDDDQLEDLIEDEE